MQKGPVILSTILLVNIFSGLISNSFFFSPKGGSVYYTGSLFDFPSFNSVSQLKLVIESDENQAYFIYADPHRMTRAVATYDAASGSIIYSMCQNVQNQNFDTNLLRVSQNELDR